MQIDRDRQSIMVIELDFYSRSALEAALTLALVHYYDAFF